MMCRSKTALTALTMRPEHFHYSYFCWLFTRKEKKETRNQFQISISKNFILLLCGRSWKFELILNSSTVICTA